MTKTRQKITKKVMEAWIRHKLGTDKAWAERALFRIYDYQTQEEKAIKDTAVNNGVGFTGFDGHLLTSMVDDIKRKREKNPGHKFSNKQFQKILFVKMPRYWKQIYNISDIDKLETMFWNDPFNIQTKLEV